LCAALLAGCAGGRGGPAGVPAARFGHLTAALGDAPFVGTFARDSVVAVYMIPAGSLQIEGDRAIGGRTPLVRLVMRCVAAPPPGVYPIRGLRTPVYAEVFVGGTAPGAWWRRRELPRGLLSDSVPPGVLELDTLDLAAGRVHGRFRTAVRSYNRTPPESLAVEGAFWGRVQAVDPPRPLGAPPLRWAPGIDRDCAAIRRPLPSSAGRSAR